MKQIDNSSACIFMFRGVQPGTETDFNVLRDLDEKMNNIMFVLNQIDFIEDSGDSDVKDVIDNITENYKNQFPNKSSMPKIYPISAKRALESREKAISDKNSTPEKRHELLKASRIEAFEERLMEFLTKGEKGKAMLTSPLNKIISFLDEEITSLKNEEAALTDKADADDINKNIEIVEKAIEDFNNEKKAKSKDISKQLDMIYNDTIAFITNEVKAFSEENKQDIKDIADHEEFNEYTSDLQNRVDMFTYRLADEANEKFNRGVKKITAEKYDEAADSVSAMIKKDDLQLELKVNFNYTEPDYDSYIKKYEEEKKAIEDNITRLENSLEGLERSSIKARQIQRDIDRENAKISSLEGRIDELDTQIKPKPVKTREEYVVRVKRSEGGGILPALEDIILGPKAVKTYSDKWDYSQVKEWENDITNRKSELNESIKNANDNISKLKSTLTEDPDYIELQKMKNTKSKNDYEKKLNELKEKHKEEFQKKAAKDLRNARNKIERYLNIDVEMTIKKMMEIKFEAKKESLESIIADITETEIKAKCKKEQDKLENLKKKQSDSAEKKQSRLAQIKENMETVSNLYDKASLLNNQLEARTAVQIETEQLRRD